MSALADFSVATIDGKPLPLKSYAGKAVLVVNVASQCGLTPQYAGLEKLHEEFAAKGLVVLGLPCNQFGAQEPGTEKEIATFCEDAAKLCKMNTVPSGKRITVKMSSAPVVVAASEALPSGATM